MKYALIKVTLVLATGLLLSCEKKVGKLPPPPSSCDTISFEKHIKPIVNATCIGCHNATFPTANYLLYEGLKAKALSGILKVKVIDQGSNMPLGGTKLPQSQLDLIQCWINNGAKP